MVKHEIRDLSICGLGGFDQIPIYGGEHPEVLNGVI